MKNPDINLKSLTIVAGSVRVKLRRYTTVIFIVFILGIYSFLVFQIGTLSQVVPDETKVNEQLSRVKRLKIDQQSVDKIEQLEDQNVRVQSLFKEARDNPFLDN